MDLQDRIKQLHQGKKYRPVGVFVLYNSVNELLLYQSAKNLEYWGFPQGGIDPNETPQVAFYRETKEEIGVIKKDLGNIIMANGIQLLNAPIGRVKRDGFNKGKAYLLMMTEYFGDNNFVLQKGEVESVKWASFKQVEEHFSELRPRKSALLLDYLEQIKLYLI
jgi:8-oxo-dGTP pyrophosphatase MutT (NUDIX family)